jgi:hypothetical protein
MVGQYVRHAAVMDTGGAATTVNMNLQVRHCGNSIAAYHVA